MNVPTPLQSMEESAYRRAYSDGIIDLFVGLFLLWIGAVWIWFTDFAGLAGVLPAIFVPAAIASRKQYVEKRLGYVQWSAPRRNKERRTLIVLYGAGVILFFAGVIAFTLVDRSLVDDSVLDIIMPGLLGWLLALLMMGLAVLMETWRFVLYSVVLASSAFFTGLHEANPGWPLLIAGAVIAVTGLAMLIVFTRSNPLPEGA